MFQFSKNHQRRIDQCIKRSTSRIIVHCKFGSKMSISTTTKAAMIINDYIWLPSCLVLIVLTVSSVAIAAGSNHHRYHLPYTHSNAQIGTLSSTPSPSTMLPHPFHSPSSFHSMANYSGDIMLGAIFPIHERDANFSCGSLQVCVYRLFFSLSPYFVLENDPNVDN